jgi:hypothetical protein
MPKAIASLIGSQEPVAAEAIAKLEQMTGYHGEDIHVLAEMEAAARRHISVLGLDPSDTRGRELYYALIGRYHVDNSHLEDILGVKAGDSTPKRLKIAVEFSSHARVSRDIWVVKHTVAKELLRQHPPRKLMKLLKYRSVESMLKRGNISQIYALLPCVESPRWLSVFWKMHTKLQANQFETKKAEVIIIPTTIASKLGVKGTVLTTAPQLGVVALWPTSVVARVGVLGLSARLLQAIGSLHGTNTYLKLQQFQPNFGDMLAKTWTTKDVPGIYLDNLAVPWRSLHAHYGKCPASQHPTALEPHIQAEDLFYQSPAQAIANIFSLGQWWAQSEKLAALYKSGPVSMNLIDVSANYAYGLSYRKRKFAAFQSECLDELLHRYLAHQAVEEYLLGQLEKTANKSKSNELFKVGSISINRRRANSA